MRHATESLWPLGLAMLLVAAPAGAAADDEPAVVLETTRVTGNEELPKVLYVLPWRDIDAPLPGAGRPVLPAPAHARPINPVTHARQMQLHERLADEENPR